jgi:hypothetical protein
VIWCADTSEAASDLLELTQVFVPPVVKIADNGSDLYIFARFFAVVSRQDADSFSNGAGDQELAKELIELYNGLVANVEALKDYDDLPFFYEKLTQEEIDEAANDRAKIIASDMAKCTCCRKSQAV